MLGPMLPASFAGPWTSVQISLAFPLFSTAWDEVSPAIVHSLKHRTPGGNASLRLLRFALKSTQLLEQANREWVTLNRRTARDENIHEALDRNPKRRCSNRSPQRKTRKRCPRRRQVSTKESGEAVLNSNIS